MNAIHTFTPALAQDVTMGPAACGSPDNAHDGRARAATVADPTEPIHEGRPTLSQPAPLSSEQRLDGGAMMAHTSNPGAAGVHASRRVTYLAVLAWLFTLFNSVRVFAYLPTMWSIWQSGRSDQHSLLTWLTWMGANATMAAWLYEHNGQRINRAVLVNIGNANMCTVTVMMIAWHRF